MENIDTREHLLAAKYLLVGDVVLNNSQNRKITKITERAYDGDLVIHFAPERSFCSCTIVEKTYLFFRI